MFYTSLLNSVTPKAIPLWLEKITAGFCDFKNVFFRNSPPHAIFNDGIISVCLCISSSVMSNSLQLRGLWLTDLFCPWNSPGKNTGVGCHSLLQEIFPIQESNLGLPHCKQTLYHLKNQGSRRIISSIQQLGKKKCHVKWLKRRVFNAVIQFNNLFGICQVQGIHKWMKNYLCL